MMRVFLVLALVFSQVVFVSASAEGMFKSKVPKAPIEIDADALEVLQNDNKAIFSGNVIAKQATMELKADTMTVFYSEAGAAENGIKKIEVDGNVFLSTPTETASGQRGVYDTLGEVVTLSGGVVLTRGQNILKGSALRFDIAQGTSKLIKSNDGSNGRVRGLFVPQ